MTKLTNNNGWGIATMIGFLIVFILFLFVIAYLVYDFDHDKDTNIQLVNEEVIFGEMKK